MPRQGWKQYSAELKQAAVQAYLSGEGSLREIRRRYNISGHHTLQDWIVLYGIMVIKSLSCPVCGAVTDVVHDYRTQTIKDIPLGRTTLLHLRKRRYRCTCGKRFFEKNTFLPRYHRVTSRLMCAVIQAFGKVLSAKEIGCRFNISGMTAMRYFNCFNAKPKELPEAVFIDEFKGNAGGEKYI